MKKLACLVALCLIAISLVAQPQQWESRGPGGGGALFLPSFKPNSSGELTVACDMSQLFHTTDYGRSWSQADFHQIQVFNNRGLIQHTRDGSTQYTIDATSLGGSDSYRATKSTDGGKTWTVISNSPVGNEAFYLYVDPLYDCVLVSDYSNLYCSADGCTTWKKIYTTSDGAGIHIAGVSAGINRVFIGINSGILLLTKSSNTVTCSKMTIAGLDSTKQSLLSFSGNIQSTSMGHEMLYASVCAKGDVYGGLTALDRPAFDGVFVTDASVTSPAWQKKVSGIAPDDQIYFVSTRSSSLCYAAGAGANSTLVVYTSTNEGQTWVQTFKTSNNTNITTGWSGSGGDRQWTYGELALGFNTNPSNGNEAAITDFGFVHITTDGGAHWVQSYVDPTSQNAEGSATPKGKSYKSVGLENTTCWQVVWLDSTNMYGCFSDIQGVRSTDAGKTWGFNYTGHSDNSLYRVIKHATSGVVYGATSTVHDMYQSTYLQDSRIDNGKGKVLFSANNGADWKVLHDFAHPVIWLAIDPTNDKRMYASVIHSSQGGVYVCNDISQGAASVWTKLTAPPRTEGHPFNLHVLNDGSLLSTWSGRRDGSGKFTASSGVYLWNGSAWTDKSDPGMQYWTKDVVFDPNDASQNTWYVCVFSGWGGAPNGKGGLYRTTNRGQTWAKINNLDRVTSLSFDPLNQGVAYMTTETDGLWYFSDIRAANPQAQSVSSYRFRQPERVFFNPYQKDEVWVSSFGNGMKTSAVQKSVVGIPVLVSPLDASSTNSSDKRIVLHWAAVSQATAYRCQVSLDQINSIIDTTLSATSLQITVDYNKQYYWKVRAISSSDSSAWSGTWKFQITETPAAVRLLSPSCDTNDLSSPVTFRWSSTTALWYHIKISKDPSFNNSALLLLDSTLSFRDTSLVLALKQDASKYYWFVIYEGEVLQGPSSDTCSFRMRVSDAVEDNRPRAVVSYPNPALNEVNINLPGDAIGLAGIQVTGMMGLDIQPTNYSWNYHNNMLSIQIGDVPNGVYHVAILFNDCKERIETTVVILR